MMKDDLKRVAPLWLKFSKKVRHDPDVRTFTGYTHLVFLPEQTWRLPYVVLA